MKDDPEFNAYYVGLIESLPCLYDKTHSDYNNKSVQDKAWSSIAKEVSETVENCKDRWKNLRASYARHLKNQNGPYVNTKKPYYLAEHLNFLRPYTRTRPFKGISISPYRTISYLPESAQTSEECDADNSNVDEESENLVKEEGHSEDLDYLAVSAIPEITLRTPVTTDPKRSPRYNGSSDIDRTVFDYFDAQRVSDAEQRYDDSDISFFNSIIPDMKQMNNNQKRQFKIGILNLAGEILDGQTVSPTVRASSCTNLQDDAKKRINPMEDEEGEDIVPAKRSKMDDSPNSARNIRMGESRTEDRFDIFGRLVAIKLRHLTTKQRTLSEKSINETLLAAETCDLEENDI